MLAGVMGILVGGASSAQAQSAPAAPPAPQAATPSIRVGATIFADYTVTESPKVTDANNARVTGHAFNVTRSYLNLTGTAARRVSFRITADIARATDGSLSGSQMFRLKYAYLDVALRGSAVARLGMQHTPLIDGQEGVYRYRFQGTSFVERDGGLSSADFGLTVRSNLGAYGDVHAGVYNGEGYTRPEVNDQKAFMARVTVKPAPKHAVAKGLRLIGYVHADEYVQGAPRNRVALSAMFEYARFNAGVDWLRRTDRPTPASAEATGQGYSVFVTPFFKSKGNGVEGLFRFDRFEPNTAADASWRRVIAGVAYWFPREGSATAALLANMDQVTYSGFTTARPTDRRFALHALINF